MTLHKTKKFIDVFDKIVKKYNWREHWWIGIAPKNVWENYENHLINEKRKKYIEAKQWIEFKIGDKVRRILRKKIKDVFNKERRVDKYSENIYKIIDIKNNKYLLEDVWNGEKLWKYLTPSNLKKVGDVIENVNKEQQQIYKKQQSKIKQDKIKRMLNKKL